MEFVLTAHRFLRFVVLVFGIVGVLRSLVSLGTRDAKFMRFDETLIRAYTGALDLQTLAGIILVLMLIGQPGASVPWIHPIFMLPAVVVAHLSRRFRGRPDRERHIRHLGLYTGSLVLIGIGLAVIGQLRLL